MSSLILFGLVLPWVLIGLGCWLVYHLVLQNGRILVRLEALDQRLGQLGGAPRTPAGLPVGSAAPQFELPDLAGSRQSLAQLRGRSVLLIFFNPRCGFCKKMVPDLATLPADGADGRPVPLLVTTGDAEENRKLFEEHSIRCPVLLQDKMEVAAQYQATGTPTGYLIDAKGVIVSALTTGAERLLALAVTPRPESGELREAKPKTKCAGCSKKAKGKANRGLAASRLNRSGLKVGTLAPAFRLPCLGGGELALEDYRGRRVLLVFSDPECDPCDQLAPQLEAWHRQRSDLQILMISRREEERNRAKVTKQGLTFPVVLQKGWEVSLRYGIFATPVGYLIDEQGGIAADVAKGVEPILALVSGAALPTPMNGHTEASSPGKGVAPR